MIRKLSALLLALTTIYLSCGLPSMATGLNGDVLLPTSQQDASEVFKSGVKFDPASHRWVDRHSGRAMDLGLPGVSEKFGGSNVISAVSSSSSNNDTTTTSIFPWKKFLIFSALGLGIATSIAVPIACGVHHHHNNNQTNANHVAIYYYFHNQTLPVPHLILPPPPPVFIHVKPPPR